MAKQNIRKIYGQALVELGHKDPRVVVLESDLKDSTQSIQFENAFPKRFIQVGIAEQNMMDVAAGLALAGKVPVTHSFATFTSMRACESVRTSICYPNLNVKMVATHAGLTAGSAGGTHHATEDIAIFRSMPNMTIFVPGDARELRQALVQALAIQGPVYIRLGAIDYEDVTASHHEFMPGQATCLRQGNDVTLVSTGFLMAVAVAAADVLQRRHGIEARVLQMASIKPLDEQAIADAVRTTGGLVTIEDHNVLGGLGGAVAEAAGAAGGALVERIGLPDRFSAGIGTCAYLMNEHGITIEQIVKRALKVVSSRPKSLRGKI